MRRAMRRAYGSSARIVASRGAWRIIAAPLRPADGAAQTRSPSLRATSRARDRRRTLRTRSMPANSGRSTGASSIASNAAPARALRRLSTLQIVGDAQHLVGGLDAFRIGFVRALRGKNLHHRFDDGDVRLLEHAESQLRPVLRTRAITKRRLPASGRRREECAAVTPQAVGRGEQRDANTSDRTPAAANVARTLPSSANLAAQRVGGNANAVETRSCALRSVPSAAR